MGAQNSAFVFVFNEDMDDALNPINFTESFKIRVQGLDRNSPVHSSSGHESLCLRVWLEHMKDGDPCSGRASSPTRGMNGTATLVLTKQGPEEGASRDGATSC